MRYKLSSLIFIIWVLCVLTGSALAVDGLIPTESSTVYNSLYDEFSQTEETGAPILFSSGTSALSYEDYPTTLVLPAAELRNGMTERKSSITVYYATETGQLDAEALFYMAFIETDQPDEGDYLRWSWRKYTATKGGVIKDGVYYYHITYSVSYYTTAYEEAVVAEEIDKILNSFGFDESDTDYIKIKTVYDYICTNVVYDHDGYATLLSGYIGDPDYHTVTAYKALTQGTAVCQGYATLFYRMVETLGLDARLIPGYSRNQGHAWNIVKIGDYYYNLDSTWDAGKVDYTYFLRSQDVFATSHTRYDEFATESFYTQYPAGNDYVPSTCDLCGHSIVILDGPINCTVLGYTTYSCNICNDTMTSDHADFGPHSFINYESDDNATCLEDGTKTAKCVRCEVTDTTRDTGSALGHDWESEYTVDLEATCTSEGKKSLHCTRCAETTDVTAIPVTGEHIVVIDQGSKATCTAPGLTEGSHCAYCEKVLVKQEVIPAFGHTEKKVSGKEANCTQSGLTEGVICSTCNVELKSQEVIQAKGHSWDHGSVTKSVSATVAGERSYTCTVCSEIRREEIPATGPCDKGETCVSHSFADALGHWGHDAIDYVVENRLMNGTGTGFEPETTMSRAMLVTVLYRYAGEPEPGENTFIDVPESTWYTDAVSWAANNGVVTGTGDGSTFSPDMAVSREQLATILYRYADACGIDMSSRAELSSYPDAGEVSSWASDALKWAVAGGLISGSLRDGETYLDPGVGANRAMVATIMMRFIQNVIE